MVTAAADTPDAGAERILVVCTKYVGDGVLAFALLGTGFPLNLSAYWLIRRPWAMNLSRSSGTAPALMAASL